MVTLSLAMIVRNEEASIEAVLRDAATFCDELIVLDTGSTDSTVQLAIAAGARVGHFVWDDDFAAARNAAIELCTQDWVVWLDADDRVPTAAQDSFSRLKNELLSDDLDAVYLPYRIAYAPDGVQCTFELGRERLLRRAAGLRWQNKVHETVHLPEGARVVNRDDAWVEHRPPLAERAGRRDRNLRILQRSVAEGDRNPRTTFYLANELRDHQRFVEAIAAYQEFVAAAPVGWERHNALVSLAVCLTACERQDEALSTLHRAMQDDASRADAFLAAGMIHYTAERWHQALPYFLAATGLRRPADGFVNNADYGWAPWDFLSICLHRTGRQLEALEALVKAAPGNPHPDRLAENAKWFLKAEQEQALAG